MFWYKYINLFTTKDNQVVEKKIISNGLRISEKKVQGIERGNN